MLEVGCKLSVTFCDEEHEHMLKEIHRLSGMHTPYQRIGDSWKYLGFQSRDPARDIRGGGVLALENLTYFLSNHTTKCHNMISSRTGGRITSDITWESFPWAPAGMNITRLLAGLFDIVEPSGRVKTASFNRKTYYPLLSQVDGFNRIYCIAFLLLDRLWVDMRATYMDFPAVLAALRDQLQTDLLLSPNLEALESRVYTTLGYTWVGGEKGGSIRGE